MRSEASTIFFCAVGDLADFGDFTRCYRQVGAPRRGAGSINQRSVLDQQIVRH